MSSRHRPEQGADSAGAYVLKRYRVLLQDDDGGRHNVIVPAALGPRDAKEQARTRFPYESPLVAEEVAA